MDTKVTDLHFPSMRVSVYSLRFICKLIQALHRLLNHLQQINHQHTTLQNSRSQIEISGKAFSKMESSRRGFCQPLTYLCLPKLCIWRWHFSRAEPPQILRICVISGPYVTIPETCISLLTCPLPIPCWWVWALKVYSLGELVIIFYGPLPCPFRLYYWLTRNWIPTTNIYFPWSRSCLLVGQLPMIWQACARPLAWQRRTQNQEIQMRILYVLTSLVEAVPSLIFSLPQLSILLGYQAWPSSLFGAHHLHHRLVGSHHASGALGSRVGRIVAPWKQLLFLETFCYIDCTTLDFYIWITKRWI